MYRKINKVIIENYTDNNFINRLSLKIDDGDDINIFKRVDSIFNISQIGTTINNGKPQKALSVTFKSSNNDYINFKVAPDNPKYTDINSFEQEQTNIFSSTLLDDDVTKYKDLNYLPDGKKTSFISKTGDVFHDYINYELADEYTIDGFMLDRGGDRDIYYSIGDGSHYRDSRVTFYLDAIHNNEYTYIPKNIPYLYRMLNHNYARFWKYIDNPANRSSRTVRYKLCYIDDDICTNDILQPNRHSSTPNHMIRGTTYPPFNRLQILTYMNGGRSFYYGINIDIIDPNYEFYQVVDDSNFRYSNKCYYDCTGDIKIRKKS